MIFKILCIGAIVIAINLLIQGSASLFWLRKIISPFKSNENIRDLKLLRILLISCFIFTLTHTIQAFFWAIFYFVLPETSTEFSSFSEAIYFSLVTFTTLGYGDISLSSDWRLLSGLEAINGIMLIGWSTAMMFSLIQTIYKKNK